MSDEGAVLHMLHCHFVFLSFLSAGIDVASPSNFIALLLLFLFFFFVSLFNIPLAAVCVFLSSITKTKKQILCLSLHRVTTRSFVFFCSRLSFSLFFFFTSTAVFTVHERKQRRLFLTLARTNTRLREK